MTKVGLAVITYNRLDYLKQCVEALDKNNWGGASFRMIVRDSGDSDEMQEYLKQQEKKGVWVAWHPNQGVAVTKNVALRTMLNKGCDQLFLIEDDILMQKPNTCVKYMGYAMAHGLHHMNFGKHGPANAPKEHGRYYGRVWTYLHCVGAFSYYTKEVIDKVGFIDENFINAWEHVEHSYRISLTGMTTPMWYFADLPDSEQYLREIPNSIANSSIRPRPDWQKNIEEGKKYWIKKHGKWLPPIPRF